MASSQAFIFKVKCKRNKAESSNFMKRTNLNYKLSNISMYTSKTFKE